MRLLRKASLFLYLALAILSVIFPALAGLAVALVEGAIWPDAVFAAVGVFGVVLAAAAYFREEMTTRVTVTKSGNPFMKKESEEQK